MTRPGNRFAGDGPAGLGEIGARAGIVVRFGLVGGSVKQDDGRTRRRAAVASALVAALAFVSAGCGGSSKASDGPVVIPAGQVNLQLPPGWKVTKGGVERPASAAATAPGGNGPSGPSPASPSDAVPLAKEDPTTSFFTALGKFQACLKDLNVKFIGIPDAKNPNSPANNPDYVKALSTCAARSNIVQALKDVQKAQDNLTPAQIEQQNKAYLKWRDCMIGRGWGIPEPKPDDKGRLFSFGGGGGGAPNFTPPPGQDIITSSDVTACAQQVQAETGGGGNTGG